MSGDRCAPPPPIRRLRVAASGDRFARLQWSAQPERPTAFHYELDWRSRDRGSTFLPMRMVLRGAARTALLSDLPNKSNYTARLWARSDCGAAGIPVQINFATKSQEIHPAITNVMPHEVVLTALVLLIWMIILNHFFKKFEKMTFVQPNTAYLSATQPDPEHKTRRPSHVTVCEEPHYASLSLEVHKDVAVRPSASFPVFRSASAASQPRHGIYYEGEPGTPEPSPRSSGSSLENVRKNIKISCTNDRLAPVPMRRKISEVLLGKATVDIRRCSTISTYVRRPKATKYAMVRRESMFVSLRRSIKLKKPFRRSARSRQGVEGIRSKDRAEQQPLVDLPPMEFKLGESTSYSSSMSDIFPESRRSRLTPPSLTISRDNEGGSVESYRTAASVVINIEQDEGEITPIPPLSPI